MSKISVVGTILFGFVASGAFVACSGVNDYPPAGEGGMQQQGQGGNTTASGGSSNGSGGSSNGSGGSSNGSGGSSNGSGGSSNGSGGSSNGSGGSSNGSGGSSNGSGGSSNGSGGAAMGGMTSTGASFTQVQGIVNKGCGANGCHSMGATAPNLGSTGATLYGTLTSTAVSRCSSQKLVNAGNASMSALVMVVTGKCGSLKMPLGCSSNPCIAQADVDTISSWINAGAKQQ